MIKRCCPVCVGEETKKVFHRDFGGMESIVPFSGYDVVQCTRCGAFYADNIGETMPLMHYYEMMSKYETKAFSVSREALAEYAFAIGFLRTHLAPEQSIIDIGCGNGAMLHMLQEQGFRHLTGLEPSEKNCRGITERWGIRAVAGALGEDIPPLVGETFDVVLMEGVLEHLVDVQGNVREALSYLKKDGALYLNVPDLAAFPDCHDLYQQFSVEHVNFFSLPSMQNLMGAFGMTCVAYDRNGYGVFTLWRHTSEGVPTRTFDQAGTADMRTYLAGAEQLAAQMKARLAPYCGREVYVWAAGTHTAMLYQLGLLDGIHVRAIIDSNANYQGKTIYSVPVIAPQELRAREPLPIIISSQLAQDAIHTQIKEKMGLPNEVVRLY
ncbi:bifunctional 2-polyprenyl-6-hydroxyphenol methylase/3-demethylubiquinol 3-O-methyltransferase UbiG [Selenomonas sp. oral taxon 138]|uniref:class I SAM-dependent methyltransferase n=1 Tax=Selenomonas sp. oral taxon 138 TaxID=712532 RepID=UPI0002A1BA1D|nr:class I SAM-dependent methyltransferase [Selenomonas sp. oral taxon 138]EKX97064.1 methyltransferase domain protein [Selenomonas sp. oral taxon 138 str. F0429]